MTIRDEGAWESFEAPGVEPAFAEPDAKRKAIDYACQRFGGTSGDWQKAVGKALKKERPKEGWPKPERKDTSGR